jgi:hypothetical protein
MNSLDFATENDLEIRAGRVYFGTISNWCTAARQSLVMKLCTFMWIICINTNSYYFNGAWASNNTSLQMLASHLHAQRNNMNSGRETYVLYKRTGHAEAKMVETLSYKPESRGFETRD